MYHPNYGGGTGKPEKYISIRFLISDRKEIEEKLKENQVELQRSNEELEQFAYVASHDLQEPLRMVSSYVKLLEKRYKDKLDTDANDFIHFAVDGAKRMKELINALLELSQVGYKQELLKDVNCNDVFDKVISNLSLLIKENNATVNKSKLPIVLGNELQISCLFQNLITNAIRYKSNNPPIIDVKTESNNKDWLFSVRDNGIGFDMQHKDRIFTIFQRLNSRANYPGTGIGLAVCKKIVELHGGKIWAESELGKGATFYFTIPKEHKN